MADAARVLGLRGADPYNRTPRSASGSVSRNLSRSAGDGTGGVEHTPVGSRPQAQGRPSPAAVFQGTPGSGRGTSAQTPASKPPLPAGIFGKTPRTKSDFLRPDAATPPPGGAYKHGSMDEGSPMTESPRSLSQQSSMVLRADSLSQLGLDDDPDSVQVMVRVRPCNGMELNVAKECECLRISGECMITAYNPGKQPKQYTYDKVLGQEAMQNDVFDVAGVPMVDNCMAGYNSSIFVYGQTGAGKTHTMMGELDSVAGECNDERGLAPRMIEQLFEKISEAEDAAGRDHLRYSCRCSCLEIYNETITDLLNPSLTNLAIREDQNKGVYVEGLSEKEVLNVDDVMNLMIKGHKNRHVGETNMNSRSSRSHCVFTCVVERCSKNAGNGVTGVVCSRLNLIDLAGSERIKGGALGGSGVHGEHFNEAVHINQSLTTLGRVISTLVEAQKRRNQGVTSHVPYRDSRLTFLLQDSLGGNAKTMIIANVSPSNVCAAETSSTLLFVASAKSIRNKATINLNYRGDVATMQKEIVRLNGELDALRSGFADPAIQENKQLRSRLDEVERADVEKGLRLQAATADVVRLKKERHAMERRMVDLQEGNHNVSGVLQLLEVKLADAEAAQTRSNAAAASMCAELHAWQAAADNASQQLACAHAAAMAASDSWATERSNLAQRLRDSAAREAEARAAAAQAEEAGASLSALYAEAREGLEQERSALMVERRRTATLEEDLGAARADVSRLLDEAEGTRREAAEMRSVIDARVAEADELRVELDTARSEAAADAESLRQRLDAAEGDAHEVRVELEASGSEVESLRAQLADAEQRLEVAARDAAAAALGSDGRRAELEDALQRTTSEGDATRMRLAAVSEQLTEATVEAEELRAQLAGAETRAAGAADEARALSVSKDQLSEELCAAKAELAEARREAEVQAEGHARAADAWAEERSALLIEAEKAANHIKRASAEITSLRGALDDCTEKASADAERASAEAASLRDALSESAAKAGADAERMVAEAEALQEQLSEAQAAAAVAAAELASSQRALVAVREAAELQHDELSRSASASEAQQDERVRSLQMEIISAQDRLVTREFELNSQVSQLSGELDKRRREAADLRSQLACKDAAIAELHSELSATVDNKADLEQQMKGHLVANNRQARAFSEIMRLINWATTPPSSTRSSVRGPDDSMGAAADGSPECSPGPAGLRSRIAVAHAAAAAMGGAPGSRGKPASSARISLQFGGGNDAGDASPAGSAVASAAARNKHMVLDVAGENRAEFDDVNSPLAATSARDQQSLEYVCS